MSEAGESTALLQPQRHSEENVYSNCADYGIRRESVLDARSEESTHLSVDELLYRIQFAFLDPGYDVEADVSRVIERNHGNEVDRLLDALNSTPLSMKQKLNIHKSIRSGGNARNRLAHGGEMHVSTHKKKKSYNSYHLWEGEITKITAYFGSSVASYFRFVRTVVYINVLMAIPLFGFITAPELIHGNFQSNKTFGGHFGELSSSFMFYGLYQEDENLHYNMPLAYLLTWLVVNLACFVCIITIMIVRYRRSKLSDDQGGEYRFAWRTFCTWDHSLTSRQGVMDHRLSLRTDIKEMVREERTTDDTSLCFRCYWYVGRILSNLMALGLMVGSGILIYKVAKASPEDFLPVSYPQELKDFFRKYQLTVVVASLKVIVPVVFRLLAVVENWHPRVETNVMLARTTVFYIASVAVFVWSLFKAKDDCNATNSTVIAEAADNVYCCWENEVGEEVFKVILMDIGIFLLFGVALNLLYALVVKCCWRSLGYSSFNIVSCVLDVVYGQSLVWLGLYFSPLLAAVAIVRLVIVFYGRYIVAKVALLPPQQLFRASSTGNFYLAILLLCFFSSLFPMAYSVIDIPPSLECGPFRNFMHPYNVISNEVGKLPDWMETILDGIGTPAVFVPLIILIIMLAVYLKVKSSSYQRLIAELRRQLRYERKVEKRKIFATGRAMSAGGLSRFTSQETLVSNIGTPASVRRRVSQREDSNPGVVFEEDESSMFGEERV